MTRAAASLAYAAALAFASVSSAPAAAQPLVGAPAQSGAAIALHVAEAARRFGMPEAWIVAVIRAESAGRIGAVSSAGAMGLMQLMPATWARQRARFALGPDPFDPRDNILAGTSYLREMYDRYGTPGFLAAYNAGPGRYEDWRDRGRALPAETRSYVAKLAQLVQPGRISAVAADAAQRQPARIPWRQAALFAARSGTSLPPSGRVPAPALSSAARLFAPLQSRRSQ